MLAPLQILRDATCFEFDRSIQPFKTILWSLRLLSLSLRDELTRRRPNSLISPCCLCPQPVTSICLRCSGCNPAIVWRYALKHYPVICLKQLAADSLRIGCSAALYCMSRRPHWHAWHCDCGPHEWQYILCSYNNLHMLLSDLMAAYSLDDDI